MGLRQAAYGIGTAAALAAAAITSPTTADAQQVAATQTPAAAVTPLKGPKLEDYTRPCLQKHPNAAATPKATGQLAQCVHDAQVRWHAAMDAAIRVSQERIRAADKRIATAEETRRCVEEFKIEYQAGRVDRAKLMRVLDGRKPSQFGVCKLRDMLPQLRASTPAANGARPS